MLQLTVLWAQRMTSLGIHLEYFQIKTYWSIKDALLENTHLARLPIFSMLINIFFPLTLSISVFVLSRKRKEVSWQFIWVRKINQVNVKNIQKASSNYFKGSLYIPDFWWVIHNFKLSNRSPSSLQQGVLELLDGISHWRITLHLKGLRTWMLLLFKHFPKMKVWTL